MIVAWDFLCCRATQFAMPREMNHHVRNGISFCESDIEQQHFWPSFRNEFFLNEFPARFPDQARDHELELSSLLGHGRARLVVELGALGAPAVGVEAARAVARTAGEFLLCVRFVCRPPIAPLAADLLVLPTVGTPSPARRLRTQARVRLRPDAQLVRSDRFLSALPEFSGEARSHFCDLDSVFRIWPVLRIVQALLLGLDLDNMRLEDATLLVDDLAVSWRTRTTTPKTRPLEHGLAIGHVALPSRRRPSGQNCPGAIGRSANAPCSWCPIRIQPGRNSRFNCPTLRNSARNWP